MGIVTLLLTEKQISTLIEEARRKHPVEACGLLFGHITEREMFIKRIVPTGNLLESKIQNQPGGIRQTSLQG